MKRNVTFRKPVKNDLRGRIFLSESSLHSSTGVPSPFPVTQEMYSDMCTFLKPITCCTSALAFLLLGTRAQRTEQAKCLDTVLVILKTFTSTFCIISELMIFCAALRNLKSPRCCWQSLEVIFIFFQFTVPLKKTVSFLF